jgi:hypothetical protein
VFIKERNVVVRYYRGITIMDHESLKLVASGSGQKSVKMAADADDDADKDNKDDQTKMATMTRLPALNTIRCLVVVGVLY